MALDQLSAELSETQRAEAQRIFDKLGPIFEDEARRLAALLASKADQELFGKTEYDVRDSVHRLGAKSLQAALEERQKKGVRRC